MVQITEACLSLREEYIKAGIVTQQSAADAMHVALATINACQTVISWNCRHIVNFRKIPKYNAVNLLNDYQEISIYTPLEVIGNEEEN